MARRASYRWQNERKRGLKGAQKKRTRPTVHPNSMAARKWGRTTWR